MKKIKTLFVREFDENGKAIFPVTNRVTEGCECILDGAGVATIKYDGTACMVKDGKLYARYDAKKGKVPPEGAIPCQDAPDPITGHFPHWVATEGNDKYKWHNKAYAGLETIMKDGTYELCGVHFNGNKEMFESDVFIPHGKDEVDVPRNYVGLRDWIEFKEIEGIVFWVDGEPMCKIKRTDFGFKW